MRVPIECSKLAEIASDYVSGMTSIRGRRVHRLIMREFAGALCVVKATAEVGGAALLAIAEAGCFAVCQTDGTGNSAAIMHCPGVGGAVVATMFDLKKDSLPIVGWSFSHPGIAPVTGPLTVSAFGFDASEVELVAELLKSAVSASRIS